MERLGFVGLGAMGSPMAKRLAAAGFELKVFGVLDERTRSLVLTAPQVTTIVFGDLPYADLESFAATLRTD